MKVSESHDISVKPFKQDEGFISVDVITGQFDFIGLRDGYTVDEFRVIIEAMQIAIDKYEAKGDK